MRILTLLFVLFFIHLSIAGQSYLTQPLSPEIQTIEVNTNGDKNRTPMYRLNTSEYMTIGFDRTGENSLERLRYRVFLCDANWNKNKELSEVDFINGFNDNQVEDYASSLNTTVEYTHFEIQIPNKELKLKLSGNYVIEVYEEDNEENTLLHACFSALDSRINIGYKISTNTDIDSNKEHQQLSLDILYPNFDVRDPLNDLKVSVMQNNRLDTRRWISKPTNIGGNKISFDHNRALIFEAGNEYRRFEIASYKYPGMHVAQIEYTRPYYSIYLGVDKVRAGYTYVYDQDQNGRFFVRNKESDDNNTESDYFLTYFTLPVRMPLPDDVYINGDFTNNSFSDIYKMQYDFNSREYFIILKIKQGIYNYQYLSGRNGVYSSAQIEGNYHETENEYLVNVYHRPVGQRYDALIGSITVYSRAK